MKSRWLAYELHTHTFHSDGSHSLVEMAEAAKELGLDGFANTDHNTASAQADIEEAERLTGLHIVRGIEWTTFYGHMVALGANRYVEWRDLGKGDIHKGVRRIHDAGGLAGVAHPFRVGSPLCTGCHWEYEVSDWSDIDYLEVWSYTFPSISPSNRRAMELWNRLLNEGHRITAVCGRDWHVISREKAETVAVTYLQCERVDDSARQQQLVLDAIRNGRAAVSMGPPIDLQLSGDGVSCRIGDILRRTEGHGAALDLEAAVRLDLDMRSGHWAMEKDGLTVRLMSNRGVLSEQDVVWERPEVCAAIDIDGVTWVRAELDGVMQGIRTTIAFTNPIYIGGGSR